MKPPLLCSFLIIALPLICRAGGNTSIVEIDKVSEVKVEENKITIQGSAVVKRLVMSTVEMGDATVFGQPAQWLYAKVENAVFEIVPYFSPGIEGVPTGGHNDEELKLLSDKWWEATRADAAKIKTGDSLTIGYQGDQTVISGMRVTKIVGYGTLTSP